MYIKHSQEEKDARVAEEAELRVAEATLLTLELEKNNYVQQVLVAESQMKTLKAKCGALDPNLAKARAFVLYLKKAMVKRRLTPLEPGEF